MTDAGERGPRGRWGWRRKALVIGMAAAIAVAGGAEYGGHAGSKPTSTPKSKAAPKSVPTPDRKYRLSTDPHLQSSPVTCSRERYFDATLDEVKREWLTDAPIDGMSRRFGPAAVDIDNRPSDAEAVLLTGMHVLTTSRKDPPADGVVIAVQDCGGKDVRPFSIDLDKPDAPLIATGLPKHRGFTGHPPVVFPFTLLPTDTLEVTATTTTCDCRFAVEVDWLAAGKPGKTVLDDGGRGFPVLAAPGLTHYKAETFDSNNFSPVSPSP